MGMINILHGLRAALARYGVPFLLTAGFLFRAKHYFENRSVWLDEACLTVSIASRSFGEIFSYFEIFPEFPKQPLFFLLIERAFVALFGLTDMVLRLFPFLCAVSALILFYLYLRKFYVREVLLWALALFAFAEPLIYYAGEVKQYASDLLAAVAFLWLFEWFRARVLNVRVLLVVMLAGMLGLWLSNALLFMLAAFGIVLIESIWKKKAWHLSFWLVFVFGVWAANLGVIYKLSLASMVDNRAILSTFSGSIYEGSLLNVPQFTGWFFGAFLEMFRGAAGIWVTPLAALLSLMGAIFVWRADRARFWMYVIPVFATILAAALQRYPFRGRLILFLIPGVMILVAEGARRSLEKFKSFQLGGIVLAGILVFPSCLEAGSYLFRSHAKIETKELLALFGENYQKGDLVVFNTAGQEPFWHYAPILGYGRFFDQSFGVYQGEMQKGAGVVKFALTSVNENGRECVPMRYEVNTYDAQGHFRRLLGGVGQMMFACQDMPLIKKEAWGRVWLYVATHDPLEQHLIDIVKRSFDLSADMIIQKKAKGAGLYLYKF